MHPRIAARSYDPHSCQTLNTEPRPRPSNDLRRQAARQNTTTAAPPGYQPGFYGPPPAWELTKREQRERQAAHVKPPSTITTPSNFWSDIHNPEFFQAQVIRAGQEHAQAMSEALAEHRRDGQAPSSSRSWLNDPFVPQVYKN